MKQSNQSRVLSVPDLELKIYQLKCEGKVIGMCHGCFDVLHFGHLIHFNEAADQVDILVVSVTPDRYVNKGPARPIFSERRRLFFLDNVRSIDYVVLNDTADAIRPLGAIKPDIYFKGADYKGSKSDGYCREYSYCENNGIRLIHTVGDSFSSTDTINLLGRCI